MMTFKVGDRVRCIEENDSYNDRGVCGEIYTVKEIQYATPAGFKAEGLADKWLSMRRFELVERAVECGDILRCKRPVVGRVDGKRHDFVEGDVVRVTATSTDPNAIQINNIRYWFQRDHFEPVGPIPDDETWEPGDEVICIEPADDYPGIVNSIYTVKDCWAENLQLEGHEKMVARKRFRLHGRGAPPLEPSPAPIDDPLWGTW
jgi:hypothetical protein